MATQPDVNVALVFVELLFHAGSELQRILVRTHEDVVMRRRLGRAGEWQARLTRSGKRTAHS